MTFVMCMIMDTQMEVWMIQLQEFRISYCSEWKILKKATTSWHIDNKPVSDKQVVLYCQLLLL